MNIIAAILTERQASTGREASTARLVARLRRLPLSWEDDAREISRAAPDAAAALSHCAQELASALMEGGTDNERANTA